MAVLLLVLLPGVMLLFVSLLILARVKRAGGSLAWTEDTSRGTKRLWGALFAVACVVILVLFGPAAMLAGWPFFIVAPALAFGCYKLADIAFIRKPRQERRQAQPDILNVRLADYLEYRPDLLALAADVGRVDVIDERGNVVHTVTRR